MCWTEHLSLRKASDIRLFKSIEELKNMARNEFFQKEDPLMDEYPECFEELKKVRNEFFQKEDPLMNDVEYPEYFPSCRKLK